MKLQKRIGTLVILAVSLLSSSSCMKKPALDTTENMKLADNNVFQSSLQEAWGSRYILDNPAILDMNIGEGSLLSKDVALNNNNDNVKLLRTETLKIQDIQDYIAPVKEGETPDPTLRVRKFIISQEIKEYNSNSESKPLGSVRELPLRYRTSAITNTTQKAMEMVNNDFIQLQKLVSNLDISASSVHTMEGEADGAEYGFERVASFLYMCDRSKNPNIECYDFKFKDTVENPPKLVMDRENCAGIKDCKIKKRNFSVHLVLNTEDQDTHEKIKLNAFYEFSISKDVPYLSRLTDFCVSQIVTTKVGKIPARFCHRVQDFKFQ